ncbi:MAG: TIR domain-containing protein [Ignavibacteriae bacterium]|nr:MAG: TIR domain-containing protein [Ignavibacteriota bacterium]
MEERKNSEIRRPKVFISYSWKPEKDKDKVKEIVDRLIEDSGVIVTIDIYDLKPGDDKIDFMEKMVKDKNIDKVLVFCNKEYAEKADSREGGVGTESMIISQEVYETTTQSKFIPVILTKDENGELRLPIFMKSRIYFDLSDTNTFEDQYHELENFLYNKSSNEKPKLGEIPKYILENNPIQRKVHHKLERFINAVTEGKNNLPILIDDYLDYMLNELKCMIIEDDTREIPFDEKINDKIITTKPIRNNFLEFFEWMIKIKEDLYIDILRKNIEKWSELIFLENSYYNKNNTKRCSQHYKFFFKEIFLYMICIALKNDKFDLVSDILNYNYWIIDSTDRHSYADYTFLQNYMKLIDETRRDRLLNEGGTNWLSLGNTMIYERVDYNNIKQEDIKEIDILLYYISALNTKNIWFPYLVMYGQNEISYMKRAESKIYFEKIKKIFDVKSKDELIKKIENTPEREKRRYDHNYMINDIEYGLNIEKLSTI